MLKTLVILFRHYLSVAAFAASLFFAGTVNGQASLHVKDYGAFPDDTIDDAIAIQAALTAAKKQHIKRIDFAAGKYLLLNKANPSLNACFGITGFDGLRLNGATVEGKPATWLVKHNPQKNNILLPAHARFDHCNDLSISGFVFDNTPQYASAGTVVEKGDGYVIVEVYKGLPAVDGMGCYTANIWDTATRNLKQVASLTFSEDVAKENLYWQLSQKNGHNYMRMNSPRFARSLQAGDGLSWHFGAPTMFQLALNFCNDLTLNNISMVNIAGWGIHAMGCKNIRSSHVLFKANGKQLAVGPRDAWKLNSCDGIVHISNMQVEGVRWDGQNVHGHFYQVKEKLAANKIRVYKKYSTVVPFIKDSIAFWNDSLPVNLQAKSWTLEKYADGGLYGVLEMYTDLPSFVKEGTLITPYATDIDQYILENSSFRNIAGCASVIKVSNAVIRNVSYDHIMYPAILFGTEITGHNEGSFPRDVQVIKCSFDHSGWIARIGKKGLVGIGNNGTDANAIGKIRFDSCSFSNAAVAIHASGLRRLEVSNSTFTNIATSFSTGNGITTIYHNNKTGK